MAPEPLHDDTTARWDVIYEWNDSTISWQAVGLATSSAGDIRGGEELSFDFIAVTNSDATDGFAWILYSDEGNTVYGTAYVGEGTGDDDSDGLPDDDEEFATQDDEEDGACCG